MSKTLDEIIDSSTDEKNTHEDWSQILEICDMGKSSGSKKILKSIMRRLFHKNPRVNMQAITLLDACSKNIGKPFNLELSSKDFVSQIKSKFGGMHYQVRSRLAHAVEKWCSDSFKNDPELSLMSTLLEFIRSKFPESLDQGDQIATMANRQNQRQNESAKEEDDLAQAIALSLKEAEKEKARKGSSITGGSGGGGGGSSLYPSVKGSTGVRGSSPVMQQQPFSSSPNFNSGGFQPAAPGIAEPFKVRALYDFEAAEDNELSFQAGEIILVLDQGHPNWWKGSNHRGEGLFPSNFVTTDLDAETEKSRIVNFNEDVQVVHLPPDEPIRIDEAKIDECLALINNADPTGELRPDPPELATLEEQCRQMGPLIDAELEKTDKHHNMLCNVNQMLMDAFSMYNDLMSVAPPPSSLYGAGQGAYSQMPLNMQMQQMGMNYNPGGLPPSANPGVAIPGPAMMNQQQQYYPQQQGSVYGGAHINQAGTIPGPNNWTGGEAGNSDTGSQSQQQPQYWQPTADPASQSQPPVYHQNQQYGNYGGPNINQNNNAAPESLGLVQPPSMYPASSVTSGYPAAAPVIPSQESNFYSYYATQTGTDSLSQVPVMTSVATSLGHQQQQPLL